MTDWKTSWGGGNVTFGGAFWAEASKDSPIDELMAKAREGEKVPLERVLDEQSVLQEVTAPNDELINFLLEHLDEMLDYITLGKRRAPEDHDAHFEHSNEHYAYISCEIFSVNANPITNAILKTEAHLERLFQILDQPSPLSPRSAGYFHMILLLLCQRDPVTILRFASKDRTAAFSIGPAAVAAINNSTATETNTLANVSHSRQAEEFANSATEVAEALGLTAAQAPGDKSQMDRGAKRRFDEEDPFAELSIKRAPVPPEQSSILESLSSLQLRAEPSLSGEVTGKRDNASLPPTISSTPKRPNMGLVPAFLRHVDSYSIACAFMVLLQAAAEQAEAVQDPTLSRSVQSLRLSVDEKAPKASVTPEEGEMIRARKLWTGGYGTASAILAVLRERDDPYSHSNAADLLSELYRRAASAKKLYVETMQMASLRVMDDEQQAPFAMNEEEFLARQQELTFAELKDFASPVGSPTSDLPGEDWTLSGIDELCSLIASSSSLNSATDAATRVLSAVVIAYTQPFSGGDLFSSKQESCPEIDRLIRRLPDLVNKLSSRGGEPDLIDTQWGGRIVRLGMGRLLLVEVVSHLILCGHRSVAKEMAYMECEPVNALLEMFFAFEWNNVLHSIVERTIRAILQGNTPTVRSITILPSKDAQEQVANNQKAEKERLATLEALLPLQKSLFTAKPSLIERILNAYDSNAAAVRVVEERYVLTRQGNGSALQSDSTNLAPRHGQKGYMGHLRNIANACAELIETQNQSGGPAIDALDEDLKQRWFDFVNGKLAECNQIVSKPLGGGPQMKKDPFHQSPALSALASPFVEENFFSTKSRVSERPRAMNLEDEPEGDDDDDDEEEDDDPEETMRRYYERKQALEKEKAGAASTISTSPQMVASSPQDSSWVVDFGSDEAGGPSSSATAAEGIFFDSPPSFDAAFFNPLAAVDDPPETVAVSGDSQPFDPFGADTTVEDNADGGGDDDFDPFGIEQEKPKSSAMAMPSSKQQLQQGQKPANDDLGVTPPGFEFID